MIKLYMEIYTLFSIEVIQLDNHNENNTEWIIAGNPDKYDVVGAFRELGTIDCIGPSAISIFICCLMPVYYYIRLLYISAPMLFQLHKIHLQP